MNGNILKTWKRQGKSAKIKEGNEEIIKTEDLETVTESQFKETIYDYCIYSYESDDVP